MEDKDLNMVHNDIHRSAIKVTIKNYLIGTGCIGLIALSAWGLYWFVDWVGFKNFMVGIAILFVLVLLFKMFQSSIEDNAKKLGSEYRWEENVRGENPRSNNPIRVRYKDGAVKKIKHSHTLNWSTGGVNPITHYGVKV